MPLKVGEIIKVIETDGWYLIATRGSHRQYKHPDKPGRVTVAGKPSDTLHPRTERSILAKRRGSRSEHPASMEVSGSCDTATMSGLLIRQSPVQAVDRRGAAATFLSHISHGLVIRNRIRMYSRHER